MRAMAGCDSSNLLAFFPQEISGALRRGAVENVDRRHDGRPKKKPPLALHH
jgi:hypothetical protein